MPNWCTTNYVIEGEKKELDSLYGMMKRLLEMKPPLVENGFGPSWLGCLVKELGEDPETIGCRGSWYELQRVDDTIRVVFETAWSPCYDVIDLLKEKFPSLRFYYRAIEPGNQVFNKNDVEGKYFPENIYAIYNGDEILALDEQEMLQKLKKEYGLPEHFTSLSEARDCFDHEEDGDNYLFFEEFAITTDESDQFTAELIRGIRNGDIKINVENDDDNDKDKSSLTSD